MLVELKNRLKIDIGNTKKKGKPERIKCNLQYMM